MRSAEPRTVDLISWCVYSCPCEVSKSTKEGGVDP